MEKILIVGDGGREQALGWNLSRSKEVSEVIYTPELKFRDIKGLIEKEKVSMTVIGPEGPLSKGLVDFLDYHSIPVFGPTQKMARIEYDKFHSYDLMKDLGIPQANSTKCFSIPEIIDAVKKFEQPVLKYRWLAKGKGVKVYSSQNEALKDVGSFVEGFGENVLVTERLYGQEISVFGIADGKNLLPFEVAFQDHKQLYDGDEGPNTGGMGAYGPVPAAPRELIRKIAEDIMLPVVRKTNYRGFLYAGIILTEEGPKVLEFNARLGDPETQPAMMLLEDSLYTPIKLSLEGRVAEASLNFREGASCCVVLASRGYPGKCETGLPIFGIEDAEQIQGIKVFHSAIKFKDGLWHTNGGRVLGVTSYSEEGIAKAQRLAYKAVRKINIPGGFHYRKDIADKAIRPVKLR